jgi:hypothetical protein
MKKGAAIYLLFFCHISAWTQKTIQLATPCNDALLQKTQGRWIKDDDLLYAKIFKKDQLEIFKRLDEIHQLILGSYPEPLGVDAAWHRSTGDGLFAASAKFRKYSGGVTYDLEKGTSVANYYYTAGFFPYFCNGRNKNEVFRGFPGETGTLIHVYANTLDHVSEQITGTGGDTMTVDGRLVRTKLAVKERRNGYEIIYNPEGGSVRLMLLHRSGALPYLPVTRKQYLDFCLRYVQKYFDEQIAVSKQIQPDKEQLKIQVDQEEKEKSRFLQRYHDELKRATASGLLDSPALVYSVAPMLYFNDKIFLTEEEGGRMLITENPDYIRKDLPKYVAQMFVVEWSWDDWPPQASIRTMMETKFATEKLQAMIDK